MAEIIENEGSGKIKGKRRAMIRPIHIDMTPMVDLACLLLTFFMLTTAFTKPKVMEIVMPETGPGYPVPQDRVVNIILDGNDRIFYYNGLADPTHPPIPVIYQSNFGTDGIQKLLLNRNKPLFKLIEDLNTDVAKGKINMSKEDLVRKIRQLKKDDKFGPIVLIKATDKAKYKNIVDIVDEMAITHVARYSITDLNSFENRLLLKTKKDLGIKENEGI